MSPQRNATFAGWVTLVAGAALVADPGPTARLLGVPGHEAGIRAIGVSDVALAGGLLRGRPRWPWMAARAATNLVVAGYLGTLASRSSSPARAGAAAASMLALTAVDGLAARGLRAAGA